MPDRYEPDYPLLLRSLAHDLRTPLATMYGFAKTIERLGDLDERQVRFLRLIQGAGEDLDRLVGHAAAIGHALTPGREPEVESFTPRLLADRVVAALPPREDGRRVGVVATDGGAIETDGERASRAIALIADAGLRLDPARADVAVEIDAERVVIDALPPVIARGLLAPGRDVALESAKVLLGSLAVPIAERDGVVELCLSA